MDALIRAARVGPGRARLSDARNATAPADARTTSIAKAESTTRPLREILRAEVEREVRAELTEEAKKLYDAERLRAAEEGREAGLAAARTSAEASLASAREELEATATTALTALERAHRAAMARLELAVGEVAFASVCRLIGERAATREFVEGIVEQVCAALKSEPVATARLHPRDIATLRELFEGAELRVAGLALEIVPDESLELGGSMLETASGVFDGTLDTQLRRLHELLTQRTPPESRE